MRRTCFSAKEVQYDIVDYLGMAAAATLVGWYLITIW